MKFDLTNTRIFFRPGVTDLRISTDELLNLIKNIMKIAREEYNEYKKHELKTHWETDEEARDFLGNALRCYEKVINECKDPQLIKNAKNQIEWIRPLYNLQNKDLVIKELQKIIAKRDKS